MDYSTFATWEHDLHRLRRSALGVYFSMQSVRRLDGLIRERVEVMLGRFKGFKGKGQVTMMSWAFAALTNGKFVLSSAKDYGLIRYRYCHALLLW
jgi:cytochrome P450